MIYPRVTEILNPYSDFSAVPPDVLEAACDRGNEVHKCCAAYALDLFHPIPDDLRGFFSSFRAYFDLYVIEVLAVEEELLNEKWGYCGHADLIAKVTGFAPGCPVVAVIDYKTPITASQTWRCQIAAYVEAAREKYGVTIGGILQLDKDGKLPKMTWVQDQAQAFNAFTGILSGWNYIKGAK